MLMYYMYIKIYYISAHSCRFFFLLFFFFFIHAALPRCVIWVVAVARRRSWGRANEREIGTQFHFYRGRLESKRTATRTDARARPRNYNAALGEGTRGTAACALATRTTKAPWPQKKKKKNKYTRTRAFFPYNAAAAKRS